MTRLGAEKIEEAAAVFLRQNFGIKLEKACFAKGIIPPYLILDRTRNIHSYATFIFKENGTLSHRGVDASLDIIGYLRQLAKIQFSELDRPLFLFLFDDEFKLSASEIEIIKDHLFSNDITEENLLSFFDNSNYFPQIIKQQL